MVKYFEGIEKKAGVQKKQISQGKFLYFVPEGAKYSFCSNDKQLQEWCEKVKNKQVKGNAIKFVVGGAQKALGKPQEASNHQAPAQKPALAKKTKLDPNSIGGWDTNIAQAFNLYCQKAGIKPPVFKTTDVLQEKSGQIVSLSMVMEDGSVFKGSGRDKQSAKKDILTQYARDVLGVKFEEDNTESPEEIFNIDQMYMHVDHDTGDIYYTNEPFDRREQESYKRLQQEQELKEKKQQAILEAKDKFKKHKYTYIDHKLVNAQVQKLSAEEGRKYEIGLPDGTKYILAVGYQNKIKKKAIYEKEYDHSNGIPPIGYTEQEMRTLTVSCDKVSDNQTDRFSMQASTPHLKSTNPYDLDLMFLANLKMTAKNAKNEDAEKAYLLIKLLEISDDIISQSPKLFKKRQANRKMSSLPKTGGR